MVKIMKNKCLVILLAAFFSLNLASAANISKVFVLDLTYSKGDIIINEYITKYGYYPDRKFQPDDGYAVEVISDDNQILYFSKFYVPNRFFIDSTLNDTNLTGGVMELDKTNFAMVLPYYSNAKSVYFFNNENESLASLRVVNEENGVGKQLRNYSIILAVVIMLTMGIYFLKKKR